MPETTTQQQQEMTDEERQRLARNQRVYLKILGAAMQIVVAHTAMLDCAEDERQRETPNEKAIANMAFVSGLILAAQSSLRTAAHFLRKSGFAGKGDPSSELSEEEKKESAELLMAGLIAAIESRTVSGALNRARNMHDTAELHQAMTDQAAGQPAGATNA